MEKPIFAFLSGMDMVAILVVALLLFGAKRLPEIARSLGHSIKEFKKASSEITSEMDQPTKPSTPPSTTASSDTKPSQPSHN